MGFSAKTEYGLVALIELAAVHGSGELLQTAEICRRHAIPERYLEQMLTALRKAGLLRSIRGPRGGFALARDPAQITVADVEACLEGAAQGERQGDRDGPEFVVLQRLGERVDGARRQVLAGLSLADLVQECDSLRQPQPMFYI
jgi:Rrf2 family cysteine metabolism transcriptional repressor